MTKKTYIIGMGLIGGSWAKDLRIAYPNMEFCGIDSNKKHLQLALEMGLVDKPAELNELNQADVVILAIPVKAAQELLPEILDRVRAHTLVMDMGSTKAGICNKVAKHKNRSNYLAMHPIAGTEYSGPNAAIAGLFKGKTNIICEIEKTGFKIQELGLKLSKIVGMRIRYMDPASHDKHLAYVSHLSHISSFMLGKTVMDIEKNERDIFDLAGSGFASTVRLAKSNPDMWAPIFSLNREHLIDALNEYIKNLNDFKAYLANNNQDEMHQEMRDINAIKGILKGIR